MSSLTTTLKDSWTMTRRNLMHLKVYPTIFAFMLGMPVVLLLLFVFVFGETMGAGLVGSGGGRADYLSYIMPGVILITIAGAAQLAAISVSTDMVKGIVSRFRTMNITRISVLTGHVVGNLAQTLLTIPILIGVALLFGFRPTATVVEWLAFLGVFTMMSLSVIWLSIALGLSAKTVESASNTPMPLMLLPFLGSGFVPTDSLPGWFQWFADNQPFTPFMELIRGLLIGTPIGNSAWLTLAWSLVIGGLGYFWARRLYNRDPSASAM